MSISRRSFIARSLGYSSLLLPCCSSLVQGRPVDGNSKGASVTSSEADQQAIEFFQSVVKKELQPTRFEYLDKDRFELFYDFNRKDSRQSQAFTRKIGKQSNDKFRWTLPEEECRKYRVPGLRISDKGMALLRVWWEDDVEVEVRFRQYVTMNPRNVFAVVFNNKSNAAVGSNYGSQCALFSRGRLIKRTKTRIQKVYHNQYNLIGLNVRAGEFAACREGAVTGRGKYPEGKFQSGRVGFFWGGTMAGVIESLKITGRIDYQSTLEGLKKRK